MISAPIYIFCSAIAIFFLYVSYKSNFDNALRAGKGAGGTQALKLKVTTRMVSTIAMCAMVLGLTFGFGMWGNKGFQDFLNADPMGLLFLLVWASTLIGCRIAGMRNFLFVSNCNETCNCGGAGDE